HEANTELLCNLAVREALAAQFVNLEHVNGIFGATWLTVFFTEGPTECLSLTGGALSAEFLPLCPCVPQSCLDSFLDKAFFHLGHGTENSEYQLASRRIGVHLLGKGNESDTAGLELL